MMIIRSLQVIYGIYLLEESNYIVIVYIFRALHAQSIYICTVSDVIDIIHMHPDKVGPIRYQEYSTVPSFTILLQLGLKLKFKDLQSAAISTVCGPRGIVDPEPSGF